MPERYTLKNEPDKTMVVFEKRGKYYGHILKNKTATDPAKFIFETAKFDSVEDLKAEFPPLESTE